MSTALTEFPSVPFRSPEHSLVPGGRDDLQLVLHRHDLPYVTVRF